MPKAVCPNFMMSPCLCLAVMMMVLGHSIEQSTVSGGSCLTLCSFLFLKFPFWRRKSAANCLNQHVSFVILQYEGPVWVQESRIVIQFLKLRENYSHWGLVVKNCVLLKPRGSQCNSSSWKKSGTSVNRFPM